MLDAYLFQPVILLQTAIAYASCLISVLRQNDNRKAHKTCFAVNMPVTLNLAMRIKTS